MKTSKKGKDRLLNISILLICLMVFSLLLISCKEHKIVDLSNRIEFSTIMCDNNDIDFFIQQITLVNVERKSYLWIEHPPSVTLDIKIKNKSDTAFRINLDDVFCSDITGIIKTTKDTFFFGTVFESDIVINSKDSCIIKVGASSIDFSFFDYNEYGNNTDSMLFYVENMEFYYMPIANNTLKSDSCRIGVSPKTKIISISKIW